MLFGTRAYRAELYRAINEVSHRQRFDVIYAGTVGSISRGISSCKADYDVKCLYVRSVKWGGILDRHCEHDIRYREFTEDKDYNCIAFWEYSAFFNFLAEPYIDNGNKYELFHNSLWLMCTPYAWDPLGLQNKLSYAVKSCVNLGNEKLYHFKIMKSLMESEDISRKMILRLIHAALSAAWIEKYKTFPPINIQGLLFCVSDNIREICNRILKKLDDDNAQYKEVNLIDEDLKNILDYVRYKYGAICSKEIDLLDYDFDSIARNKNIVKKIIDTVGLAIKCVPQIESEPYLSYRDVCSLEGY